MSQGSVGEAAALNTHSFHRAGEQSREVRTVAPVYSASLPKRFHTYIIIIQQVNDAQYCDLQWCMTSQLWSTGWFTVDFLMSVLHINKALVQHMFIAGSVSWYHHYSICWPLTLCLSRRNLPAGNTEWAIGWTFNTGQLWCCNQMLLCNCQKIGAWMQYKQHVDTDRHYPDLISDVRSMKKRFIGIRMLTITPAWV